MSKVNTKKLQRSHIRIAGEGLNSTSTYNDTFIQHDIALARGQLSEEKKADLRRSHFDLAYVPNAHTEVSETRQSYVPYPNATRTASTNLHGLHDNIRN